MPSGLFLVAFINGEQCIPNPTIPRCSHSKRATLLRSEKFSLSLKKETKIILILHFLIYLELNYRFNSIILAYLKV